MTEFLLTISYIIHLITLFIIVVMWRRFDALEKNDLEQVKREIEDILIAYTTEMKEDNEAFLDKLQSHHGQIHEKKTEKDLESLHLENIEHSSKNLYESDKQQINSAYLPPSIEDKEEFGPSITAKVLSLRKQGYSLEEIAKKVEKGKGEVELLLKFHQD